MAETNLEQRVRMLESDNQALQREVQRLRADNRRWARLAGTDGLTGLPNKISFLRVLVPQRIRAAMAAGETLGFILLSADDLGPINEAHGRGAGDQVLKDLGVFLQRVLDGEDQLGHIDGSHFSVMAVADLDAIRGVANMLRARVQSHTFACGSTTIQITVSAGVVAAAPSADQDEKTLTETIFDHLSEALYVAKASGGNRVQAAAHASFTHIEQ